MRRQRSPADTEIQRLLADVRRVRRRLADLLQRIREEQTAQQKLTGSWFPKTGKLDSDDHSVH